MEQYLSYRKETAQLHHNNLKFQTEIHSLHKQLETLTTDLDSKKMEIQSWRKKVKSQDKQISKQHERKLPGFLQREEEFKLQHATDAKRLQAAEEEGAQRARGLQEKIEILKRRIAELEQDNEILIQKASASSHKNAKQNRAFSDAATDQHQSSQKGQNSKAQAEKQEAEIQALRAQLAQQQAQMQQLGIFQDPRMALA
jgi:chromosome segregation ATPase